MTGRVTTALLIRFLAVFLVFRHVFEYSCWLTLSDDANKGYRVYLSHDPTSFHPSFDRLAQGARYHVSGYDNNTSTRKFPSTGNGIFSASRRDPGDVWNATVKSLVPSSGDGADTLASAMRRATHTLFHDNSLATEYLNQSNNYQDFRFYVYNNLAVEQTWQYVETCMNTLHKSPDDGCGWIDVCGETGVSGSRYGKKRYNRNGDVLLAKLFSQYTGSLRTYNPSEASLFIVPFPSQGSFHCMGSNQTYMDENFVNRLTFFNKTSLKRHLFLSSALRPAANLYMHRFPLQVTIGPATHYMCKFGRRCGNIIMPYVNTNPEYQPDQLLLPSNFRSLSERKFGLAAFFNPTISGNSDVRHEFLRNVTMPVLISNNVSDTNSGNGARTNVKHTLPTMFGNRPILVGGLGVLRSMPHERDILESYRNSIFCPCLRGDAPPQKRFFDAILSGCLPVVLTYPAKGDGKHKSHFAAQTESIRITYPFAEDIFFQQSDRMGIRYEDFVIEVDGACGPTCIVPTLNRLLQHGWEELEKKQKAMKRVAALFSYGMRNNDNALVWGDAVAAILVQARHFVNSLPRSL